VSEEPAGLEPPDPRFQACWLAFWWIVGAVMAFVEFVLLSHATRPGISIGDLLIIPFYVVLVIHTGKSSLLPRDFLTLGIAALGFPISILIALLA